MMTITVNNREWTVEATGLERVAYTLTSGRKVVKGIRNQVQPDTIIVMDGARVIGRFNENTWRELAAL